MRTPRFDARLLVEEGCGEHRLKERPGAATREIDHRLSVALSETIIVARRSGRAAA